MKIVTLNKSRSFGGRPIAANEPTPVSDDLAQVILSNRWGQVDEAATAKAKAAATAEAEEAKAKAAPKAKAKAKVKPKSKPNPKGTPSK